MGKDELVAASMNVYYLPELPEEVDTVETMKFPLSKLPAAGALLSSVKNVLDTGFMPGGEGIYKVVFKEGVTGTLAAAKDGSGLLGTVVNSTEGIAGQARLVQVPLDPTSLFMAIAIASIDAKLSDIQETQKTILTFIENDKKAHLKGNLDILMDIMKDYHYNWNNELFIKDSHMKSLDIQQESKQNVIFYQEQIKVLLKKNKLIHVNADFEKASMEIQKQLRNYQLALYTYAFASFLDVMLKKNFNYDYVNSISSRIIKASQEYREVYTNCYDCISRFGSTSVESLAMKGLGEINKLAGKAIAAIPVVSNGPVDEALISTGDKLEMHSTKKLDANLNALKQNQLVNINAFADSISRVGKLFNEPIELMFDKNNIYARSVSNRNEATNQLN